MLQHWTVNAAVLGTAALVASAVIISNNARNMKRRARMLRTATTSISRAKASELAEIKGKVVVGPEGVVRSAVRGRAGVWSRVIVDKWLTQGKSGRWERIYTKKEHKPFFVDDGSRPMARIEPARANAMLHAATFHVDGLFRGPSAQVAEFLSRVGIFAPSLGEPALRIVEEVLEANVAIYALGPARREPGPPVIDGYRTAPSDQLVLVGDDGDEGELIVSDRTEAQLMSRLAWPTVGGVILGAAGAVVDVVALASWLAAGP